MKRTLTNGDLNAIAFAVKFPETAMLLTAFSKSDRKLARRIIRATRNRNTTKIARLLKKMSSEGAGALTDAFLERKTPRDPRPNPDGDGE